MNTIERITPAERDDQPPLLVDETEVLFMAGRGGVADPGFVARVAAELPRPKVTTHVAWGKTCFSPQDARRIAQHIIEKDEDHAAKWDAYVGARRALLEEQERKALAKLQKHLDEAAKRRERDYAEWVKGLGLLEKQRREAEAVAIEEGTRMPDFEAWKAKA